MRENGHEINGLNNKSELVDQIVLVSRPVLPDWELTKGGSAIVSGCQQCARAKKL